jgi:hypothetical protein
MVAASNGGDLWAITSYFNPLNYRRRRSNYRLFHKHLNVPLLTVELAYGSEFELSEADADIMVRLRGSDVLWQKERLLNLALGHLPDTCCKLALIDCDVIFERQDCGERLSELLDRFMLVQMFGQAHYMGRDWLPGHGAMTPEHMRPSAASVIASGVPASRCLDYSRSIDTSVAPGFAWAARREVFERSGIYDSCVVGGAVTVLASAAYGCFDHAMGLHRMNDVQKQHYMAWAQPFHALVRNETSFLDGKMFHLWHGEFANRRYRERHQEFSRFHFNPLEDVALDDNGCWRWNTNKPMLHAYVRDYLASRKEDG